MAEQNTKWERQCPDCNTVFGSVQCWGICPQCELRFLVDRTGNLIDRGNRPADRSAGIALSERTLHLITTLFPIPDGVVIADVLRRAVSENIPFCDNASPEEMERIRFAILKMTVSSPLNLAVGIQMAQSDWRDLLMNVGFGDDTSRHLDWYAEQTAETAG